MFMIQKNRVFEDSSIDTVYKREDILLLQHYFNFLTANMTRSKTPFTLVFVAIHSYENILNRFGLEISERILEETNVFLQKQTRNSDLLFTLPSQNKWVFLLPLSTMTEANYFLKRIFSSTPSLPINEENFKLELSASIVGISHSKVTFEDVLNIGKETLDEALIAGPFEIGTVETFIEPEIETIKVSIIEGDDMVQDILQMLLRRIVLNYFQLEIRTFSDGDEFLQSDWYQSGHTHIVILDDILPKKAGIEVLQELRRMPNTGKYIIFMLSKGRSEEDLLAAYDLGVDEYIKKPFNVKLVEAQLKRWLKRLR